MAGGIHRALDRIRFGTRRTLNVRDGLLSGAEAARRVDGWLRARQVELDGDLLVITGRGAGSADGIAVVREATRRTLYALKRGGVIEAIREDTPGSFVVSLAPLRTMLDAPNRRKPGTPPVAPIPAATIKGLNARTQGRLWELSAQALDALGIRNASTEVMRDEMERQFSRLVASAPAGAPLVSPSAVGLDRKYSSVHDHQAHSMALAQVLSHEPRGGVDR
jgi:hypothetical protein